MKCKQKSHRERREGGERDTHKDTEKEAGGTDGWTDDRDGDTGRDRKGKWTEGNKRRKEVFRVGRLSILKKFLEQCGKL